MSVELQRVLETYGAELRGATYMGKCPLCEHSALAISPGKKQAVVVNCFKCGTVRQQELAKLALAVAHSDRPVTGKLPQAKPGKDHSAAELWRKLEQAEARLPHDGQAQSFLAARGISLATAQAHRLGAVTIHDKARVVIPYLGGTFGEYIWQLRYRQIVVTDKAWKWYCEKLKRGYRRLYNLPLLQNWQADDPQPLVITEAELDALMLTSMGVAASSVDGAGHSLVAKDTALLRGVRHLVLAFDNDEEGRKCTARFKAQLPHARVLCGYEAKDLGDLRTAMGHEAFTARLQKYLGGSK
jgi:hypothetical protein